MVAVPQQMREVVREFGMVHEDQVRMSGSVQVNRACPQAEPYPVGAQDRQLATDHVMQGHADRTLLFVSGMASPAWQAVGAAAEGMEDVVPQQPATGGHGGMDHDTSHRGIVGGQGGAGEAHIVTAVHDHRARRTARGAQHRWARAPGTGGGAAHQNIDGDLAEGVDRVQQADAFSPPLAVHRRSYAGRSGPDLETGRLISRAFHAHLVGPVVVGCHHHKAFDLAATGQTRTGRRCG
ncbi:hypothetical protein ACFYRC_35015 [Streptomyces sp. NPDC005279]|uniref:hypothetical protein n=1 Tax=Streptomyces sp. NPDC005279 TaxID=3364712 RepID=UPI00368F0BDE